MLYFPVIKSFRTRALKSLWQSDDRRGVRADLVERVIQRLLALDRAEKPEEMNLPGFNFHRLRGKPVRYSVHVNGPWCITFEWRDADAVRVDLEQYH